MSKQTKKGNQAAASQIGKNAKKAAAVITDVQEIFDVDSLVLEPEQETTEIELTNVETAETNVETTDNSEVTELPVVKATTVLQPETVTEVTAEVIAAEETELQPDTVTEVIAEAVAVGATELQPETVTVEVHETPTEPAISEETNETPVVVENVELQIKPVVETIVAPEATETPVNEVVTALQPETVTKEPVVTSEALTVVAEAKDKTTNEPESNVIIADAGTTDTATINNSGESETKPQVTGKTPPLKKQAPKPPVAKEKKQSPKKATDETKEEIVKEKKVTLAESGYHWYRNWLRDWIRSHGAPSARFTKSAENYNGTITVLESEKEMGVLALKLWVKENPDVKEMFWAVNK